MINSGIPNMWTLHKPVFDSNWMNISSTYFIYPHIFVFHWSIIDIVAELLFALIYIMYPFLLFDTFKHNSSSSTQFSWTFMLQKFYWNVSVHPNFGYYRTEVMEVYMSASGTAASTRNSLSNTCRSKKCFGMRL